MLGFSVLLFMSSSCDKGSEGCTDPMACNYDNNANIKINWKSNEAK